MPINDFPQCNNFVSYKNQLESRHFFSRAKMKLAPAVLLAVQAEAKDQVFGRKVGRKSKR